MATVVMLIAMLVLMVLGVPIGVAVGVAALVGILVTDTPLDGAGATWKAIEDYLLGLAITAIVSPLILAIALGVKLSSRGPVLYRQERVTWNGRRFTMLKFRTMPADAEAESGPVWMRRGEKRTTALGAMLRRFSLDELPQLVNVLRGDMSLVGPRPERPGTASTARPRWLGDTFFFGRQFFYRSPRCRRCRSGFHRRT